MDYSISGLAKLAGVSARTLRHYDAIGLLSPRRMEMNGYRAYGPEEVARLQQILLYREMGVPLENIRGILRSPGYDALGALEKHLAALHERKAQLETLIHNVEKTIQAEKGETAMSDREKFEGFKKNLIDENERKFGAEARKKFGDAQVNVSNAKVMGMTQEKYDQVQELSSRLNETLKHAMAQGDPKGELAQKAAALHREWLGHFWNFYSKEAHVALAQSYVDDPRFQAYYDAITPGAAVFLRDAIVVYCSQD